MATLDSKKYIQVNTKSKSYKVYIDAVSKDLLQEYIQDSKVLIISNESIYKLFESYLYNILDSKNANFCILPDGEKFKNMKSIEKILDSAFEAKLNRNSLMISFGGGVISDMVGFASGIYERGIDFLSIPTSLLAMVDASVGGKCGINNKYGKNLIGLFHQPNAVFVDMFFLKSLPRREFCAGLAEIIKILTCFNFSKLKVIESSSLQDSNIIKNLIFDSIKLKAYVVENDEKEKNGLRALLNYGHTFAHSIELECKFRTFLHGEAVAMGIVMANVMSVRLGILSAEIADFIESKLRSCGLPTRYKIKNVTRFFDSFFLDKKSVDSKLHFVLLESSGDVELESRLESSDLDSKIKATLRNDIDKKLIFEVLNEFC